MNLKQCKVLLVDDIKANVNILNKALGNDYIIDSVGSGAEVLPYVTANPTDLILLDILMPDMDGYDVLRKLKADEYAKDIPVIFITSKNTTEDESQGLALGAVDYITKPFSIPIVQARVRNHLIMKKQRDLLENLSHLDALTGIANRRCFDKYVDHELHRAQRTGASLSLILIDVDYFKAFNDTYGHTAGDACLKQVANTLANSVRRHADFVARYGGEEFAAVLPATDITGALTVAQTMLESIRALKITHGSSVVDKNLTISIGVSSLIPQKETLPNTLIQTADQALYRAKHKGRNRIEVIEP